jgi:hypothetical protein
VNGTELTDGGVACLRRGFDYAPDPFVGVARELSGDNGPAFIAAIVLEDERAVALRDTDEREVFLPLHIDWQAVDVGASIADFHGAS